MFGCVISQFSGTLILISAPGDAGPLLNIFDRLKWRIKHLEDDLKKGKERKEEMETKQKTLVLLKDQNSSLLEIKKRILTLFLIKKYVFVKNGFPRLVIHKIKKLWIKIELINCFTKIDKR